MNVFCMLARVNMTLGTIYIYIYLGHNMTSYTRDVSHRCMCIYIYRSKKLTIISRLNTFIRARVDYLPPSHVFYLVTACRTSDDLSSCSLNDLDTLVFVLPNTDMDDNCLMVNCLFPNKPSHVKHITSIVCYISWNYLYNNLPLCTFFQAIHIYVYNAMLGYLCPFNLYIVNVVL